MGYRLWAEMIKQRGHPTWKPDQMICIDGVDLFRWKYVEDALNEAACFR